jgi:flagellar hook assembly protein FlgD
VGEEPEAEVGTSSSSLSTEAGLRLSAANPSRSGRMDFTVPAAGRVTLIVFDLQGRKVRTLLDQDAAAGSFSATWDGRGDDGSSMTRGIYFARLTAGGASTQKKIVLE